MEHTSRRSILKLSGGALAAACLNVTGTASARGRRPDPVAVKGTINNPVKSRDVEYAREKFLEDLQSMDAPMDEVALASRPIPEDGILAGYAIDMKDGAPIEKVCPVSPPQTASEIKTPIDGPRRHTSSAPHNNRHDTPGNSGSAPEFRQSDAVAHFHNEIDAFVSRTRGER